MFFSTCISSLCVIYYFKLSTALSSTTSSSKSQAETYNFPKSHLNNSNHFEGHVDEYAYIPQRSHGPR